LKAFFETGHSKWFPIHNTEKKIHYMYHYVKDYLCKKKGSLLIVILYTKGDSVVRRVFYRKGTGF
jgi:hypothetical protein